jgi:hypothetical protein
MNKLKSLEDHSSYVKLNAQVGYIGRLFKDQGVDLCLRHVALHFPHRVEDKET